MGNMPNAVKSPAQRLSRLEARREKLLVIIHRTRTRWEKADKAAQKHMRALIKLERQLIRMDKTIAKAKVETANELVETAKPTFKEVHDAIVNIPQVETDHLPEPEFEKLAEKMADEANGRLKRKRKNKKKDASFEIGNQVRVSDAPDATIFEVVRLEPDGSCFIREEGLAPNGKPYAEQRSDVSLLRHAVTDELLKNLSFGPFKAGRKNKLSV